MELDSFQDYKTRISEELTKEAGFNIAGATCEGYKAEAFQKVRDARSVTVL
jgi:hypothetical protein